ncbi:MAG: hypothetical protein IPM42_02530 [Saprospiraceae bacterium]|nr:hypothetical protein [Saprospiraceae bacterium]
MKSIINVVLVLVALILAYWLYATIQEPIAFKAEKVKRQEAVVATLKKIQITQDVYRLVTGKYAGNFDTLVTVIKNGKIENVKLESDPSDPTNQDKFIRTVSYWPALDSLYSIVGEKFSVDSLRYIPFGEGKTFDIAADTLRYQNTLVQVVQVGTRYKDFMGQFGDARFKKYDAFYDPDKLIKFGDMSSPNTNGNW